MKNTLLLALLLVHCLSAQEEFNPDYVEYHAEYTPVTPNAASFLQYGNTLVNHATGVPQISIPLFTIEEDGVSIPISLSYHASGVKVDDLSSVVGLKWTLNAGGGIFRQVNDKIDEEGWIVPDKKGYITPDWVSQHSLFDYTNQQIMETSNKLDDYYPDDFTFSFLNYNGTFIFNPDGTVVDEYKDAIAIQKTPGTGFGINFEARDAQGNTFYFNNTQEHNAKRVYSNNDYSRDRQSNVSGWMLDRILTKNSKEIQFTYTPYTLEYTLHQISHNISYAPACINEPGIKCVGCANDTQGAHNTKVFPTSIQYTSINQLVSTIETEKVKATFNYVEDVSLSTWKKQLSSITILDKIKNKTKRFEFTYRHFSGDARLRLDAVQEIGFDGSAKPPYRFEYVAGALPEKASLSKDFHGFYNGKNNTSLVPYSTQAYNTINQAFRNSLADRREDTNYLAIGTLQKITYPTGGSTEFEYEANAVPSTTNDNPRYITKYASVHASSAYTTSGSYRVFRSPFTITEDLSHLGTLVTYTTSSSICNFDPLEPSIDCSPFNIYQVNTDGSLGAAVFSPSKLIGAEGSVDLLKGDYMLELKVEDAKLIANPTALISVNLSWDEQEAESTATRYTGGLRVQSVIDKDADGSIAKQTQYSYSGLTGYSLNLSDTFKSYGERAVFSSDNLSLEASLIKSGYFYDTVTIETIGDDGPIKTIEYFKELYRNKSYESVMTRQEFYEGSSKVKTVDLEYTNTLEQNLQFWVLSDKDECYQFSNTILPGQLGYRNMISRNYYHRKNELTGRTEVEYYSGTPFKAFLTQYRYQYNDDMQIIKQELDGRYYATSEQAIINKNFSTNPYGKHTIIQYTYPVDHALENSSIATLQNNYQVGLPVSKTVTTNGSQILGQFMDYDAQGNVVATYRHHKGETMHTHTAGHIPSDYELRQEFILTAGKPVEVQRKDGLPTTILWDATHSYVLAQLVGVTKAELDAVVTGVIDLKTKTHAQLRTLYGTLRSSFPEAQITTYIHEPLQGVLEVTDPRGYTTQYNYDGLSRLTQVKDEDSNLISKQQYHYKNQQ
ncbi:RHS repeat protein [Aquimarina celericrescens]|nr:RHS repeat protein [Aquimarina celericrescens]